MIRPPLDADWSISHLAAERRAYLESGLSFEKIANQIADECKITDASIRHYETAARGEPKNARQIVFQFSVTKEACDLFFNAPDGLRGRYWQSPDHGFAATHYLIKQLSGHFVNYAEKNPPKPNGKAAPMNLEDIAASLSAPSAKIWVQEKEGNELLLVEIPNEEQLRVKRWIENEELSLTKKAWRRTSKSGKIEVKGAILGIDGTEYVPKVKKDRSCQIHQFGFT